MDDSLTNTVSKDQVMFFKLGGATEYHAPELGLELRDAKAEVGTLASQRCSGCRAHC